MLVGPKIPQKPKVKAAPCCNFVLHISDGSSVNLFYSKKVRNEFGQMLFWVLSSFININFFQNLSALTSWVLEFQVARSNNTYICFAIFFLLVWTQKLQTYHYCRYCQRAFVKNRTYSLAVHRHLWMFIQMPFQTTHLIVLPSKTSLSSCFTVITLAFTSSLETWKGWLSSWHQTPSTQNL